MHIYSGGKPYECERCHKEISQFGALEMHMQSHYDEKPYLKSTYSRKMFNGVDSGEKPSLTAV